MKSVKGRLLATLLAILLVSFPGVGQDQQKKLKSASLDGTTGLFKAWDAETLRKNELNLGLGFDYFNRDPGQLTIKVAPASGAFGVTDRFEVFAGIDFQRIVNADNIKTYRLLPGQLPVPAMTPLGSTSFSNDAPFMDVPRAAGLGDIHLGAKYNILSERTGKPVAFALAAFLKAPTNNDATYLNRGLGTGEIEGGFMGLLSKRAGKIAQLHLNLGMNFAKDPRINGPLADLQDSFVYKGGAAFPTYGRFQLIGEVSGRTYFGTRTRGLNPRSPVDVIGGIRIYLTDHLAGGIGYQGSLRHVKEDVANGFLPAGNSGMVAQLTYGKRRNDPPKMACAVAKSTIKQDEQTTIRANASDPDNDPLKFSWSASGGKITGSGDTVTFDATGIAPGKYTVTGTVSDGKHQVSCTSEITVIKKNLPPTVACEPSSRSVTQGESAEIKAASSDPNNDALTFSWTVNGEKLASTGSSVEFGTAGRNPGQYTVSATVSDGEFTATCSSVVTVKEPVKVNRPPTIECLTSTADVRSGSSIELRARVADPDNDKVAVTWSSTAGTVAGSGETATFNASGLTAGVVTVTAKAEDGRGGTASCTTTINVSERVLLAKEGKVPCGGYAPGGTRVDNCAKAALDDLALRMKNDPHLMANVIGYTDGSKKEAAMKGLGGKRAKAAADYLIKKGADASRITVTDGGPANPIADSKTPEGRSKNRRVEIELTVR